MGTSLDEKSKQKAYELFESGMINVIFFMKSPFVRAFSFS